MKESTKPIGRKRQVVATVTALAIVGGGVAWAAYSAQMSMKGNIGAGQFRALYGAINSSNTIGQLTVNGNATPLEIKGTGDGGTMSSGEQASTLLTLPAGVELFTGESASLSVWPVASTQSSRTGYVSGFAGSVTPGWKAEIAQGCGSNVEKMARGTSPVVVKFTNVSATDPLDTSKFGISVTSVSQNEPKPGSITCAPLSAPAA